MAVIDIGTYDGLLEAAADWINRADLADRVPNFVTMAEAGFNRELRVRDMMVTAQAVSVDGCVELPDDFLQEFSLTISSEGREPQPELAYVGKLAIDRLNAEKIQGGPVRWYTIIDGTFQLMPPPQTDVPLDMVYYAKIPKLGEIATEGAAPRQTNWLIERSPDLYLSSTLMQAAPYINDEQRLQVWVTLRGEIMEKMRMESERSMRSSTQLTARARGF